MPWNVKNLRASVVAVIALASSVSTAHSTMMAAAQTTARPGILGAGAAPVSEARCAEIDIELARLSGEERSLVERLTRAPISQRESMRQQLAQTVARTTELQREQMGCNTGPLKGSVTDGQSLPSSSGGNSPAGREGLPGAPVPWGVTPAVSRPGSGGPSVGARTDGLTPAQRTSLCKAKFDASSLMRVEAPKLRGEIAALEREVNSPYTGTARRAEATLELQAKRERQTYIASEISILEESMQGITGCNTATGTVVEVRPPAADTPKVPAGLGGTGRTVDRTPSTPTRPRAAPSAPAGPTPSTPSAAPPPSTTSTTPESTDCGPFTACYAGTWIVTSDQYSGTAVMRRVDRQTGLAAHKQMIGRSIGVANGKCQWESDRFFVGEMTFNTPVPLGGGESMTRANVLLCGSHIMEGWLGPPNDLMRVSLKIRGNEREADGSWEGVSMPLRGNVTWKKR